MAFRVGQKVVCVDAGMVNYGPWPLRKNPSLHGLRQNSIYTIREIDIYRGEPAVRLAEITRPSDKFGEAAYSPRRFRPVQDRKTDISIFTAILNGAPVKEDSHV